VEECIHKIQISLLPAKVIKTTVILFLTGKKKKKITMRKETLLRAMIL
jgi:hypothetical protein